MQKIIIDTNVVVSALIQKSYPYLILYNYVLEGLVEVCISEELFEEYVEVLNRPKFSKYTTFSSNAEIILSQIKSISIKYNPKIRLNILKDYADNRLLELSVESSADFIITGNTNHFIMKSFQGTKVVSPKEYWEIQNKIIQ